MHKQTSIIFLLLICNLVIKAQNTDSTLAKPIKNKSIIVLPVAFRLPETGWGGGIAGTASWKWAKDMPGAKPSQLSAGLTFTQKKQVLVFVPFSTFIQNDKYYLNGDLGWFKYNFFYYGVGENRVNGEVYDVKYPRIKLLLTQKIAKNIYGGVRLNYEEYNMTGVEEGGELASGTIEGSAYSRTSAIGPAVVLDSRDAIFYPKKGFFGELSFLQSSKIFGADRSFSQFTFDMANYQSFGKKIVLATNVYNVISLGEAVPYSQMGMLGGAKKMRGVYQGFFRDNNALLFQGELRWEVWKFIGLTGFGSMGFTGNQKDFIRFNFPKFTYGAGLRIASKNHLNLRLDYGLSPYGPGNFYATVGEAF